MGAADFLVLGDVVNVVLTEEAFPFVRDSAEARNVLQGRVIFADEVGLNLYSDGGRCMPLFADDSSKIEESYLTGDKGTFFPWRSVVSVKKVTDAAQYEIDWQKHELDQEAFHNANGSWAASSSEFQSWRRSLSQAAYGAAYNQPQPD